MCGMNQSKKNSSKPARNGGTIHYPVFVPLCIVMICDSDNCIMWYISGSAFTPYYSPYNSNGFVQNRKSFGPRRSGDIASYVLLGYIL